MTPQGAQNMRMRAAQPDEAEPILAFEAGSAIRYEIASGNLWNDHDASPEEIAVVELDDQIVAVARHRSVHVARVRWHSEPLPELPAAFEPGERAAVVGTGLVIAEDRLSFEQLRRVHRLTRSLLADERGAKYTLAAVPLPVLAPFDAAGVTQQIRAGAVDWSPLSIPLHDGYWPVAIADPRSVWIVREANWV